MISTDNAKGKSEQAKLRHEFVGMMFALAIGEVGLQTASLVQAGNIYHYLPAYSHLLLATIVIATSWVGWSLSWAPGVREDVTGILQWEFIILLLDVALVITYFILVRTINFSESGHSRIDPASKVAFWVVCIFALYLVWDCVSKILVDLRKKEGDWRRKYGSRMLPTILCLGVAWFIWQKVGNSDKVHFLSADAALLSLILLFRALKEVVSAAFPTGDKRKSVGVPIFWSVIWSIGVTFGALATVNSWRLPLPNYIITQINAPDPTSSPSRAALRAASRVSNQDVLSNSLRTLALNDSTNALSVGFPGREKSSSILLLYSH